MNVEIINHIPRYQYDENIYHQIVYILNNLPYLYAANETYNYIYSLIKNHSHEIKIYITNSIHSTEFDTFHFNISILDKYSNQMIFSMCHVYVTQYGGPLWFLDITKQITCF